MSLAEVDCVIKKEKPSNMDFGVKQLKSQGVKRAGRRGFLRKVGGATAVNVVASVVGATVKVVAPLLN